MNPANAPRFVADAGWLSPHPAPRKPRYTPPPGAVDAHCHVFGPGEVFPYAAERKYTPTDAPKEKLFALRDALGFERNVIVQGTCHGADNRALVDALRTSNGRARGVATVGRDVSDAELQALHEAGVRGVRFNFVRRLVDVTPPEVLREIAARIQPLGWHVVVYFESQELPALEPFFAQLPMIVVVDHMGRPDVRQPVDGPEFERFMRFMRDHDNIWSKVSGAERLSTSGPPDYSDFVPVARRVVETFPDRVLWGTDWPHPNLKTHMPDDGDLVDLLPKIAPTADLQQRLLVDNPRRLYWARPYDDIPGTTVFDAEQSRKGYHLNMFCMSLMKAANRERFKANERSYLDEWPMTEPQKQAVLNRDFNRMMALGGNIYFLAKIFATDGKSFQWAAASMTGMSQEEYARMMLSGGRAYEPGKGKGANKGGDKP
jgi:2-pyrone-4,6-dicarboxylate lactonase